MYELLGRLKGSKLYSTIELNQGYKKILIDKDDIQKSRFKIMNKTFVSLRMPFGLFYAPSTFKKVLIHYSATSKIP